MPIEYELKYLMDPQFVRFEESISMQQICQYYVLQAPTRVFRIRRYESHQNAHYELTLKFKRSQGSPEFNWPIDVSEGDELFQYLQEEQIPCIQKKRYLFQAMEIPGPELFWEVDHFEGALSFLTVAELEYPGPEKPTHLHLRPHWYPKGTWPIEVTSDPAFLNAKLALLSLEEAHQLHTKVKSLLQHL